MATGIASGSALPSFNPTPVQSKVLSGNITSSQTMTDLTFSGLTIGQEYQVNGQFYLVDSDNNGDQITVNVYNGVTTLCAIRTNDTDGNGGLFTRGTYAFCRKFIATDTTVTFAANMSAVSVPPTYIGGSNDFGSQGSWVQLQAIAAELVYNPVTKWQEKILGGDYAGGLTTLLQFNNLTIGKTYRCFVQGKFGQVASSSEAYIQIVHNGTEMGEILYNAVDSGGVGGVTVSTQVVFVAASTTVEIQGFAGGGVPIRGTGNRGDTFAQLEELPNHIQVNDWD